MTENTKFWETGKYKYGFVVVKGKNILDNILPKDWLISGLPNKYYIAYSPDVKYCCRQKEDNWVVLCGNYCMDVIAGHMEFSSIVETLLERLTVSEDEFNKYLDDLNGRFVCIYSREGKTYVLNDAVGERSVYYSTDQVVIASHYNLVHDIVQTKEDSFWKKYCEWVADKKKEHKPWPWVMPGDRTPWEKIKILTPNHRIILPKMLIERFYPRSNIPEVDVNEATKQISQLIKREAETLSKYYKIYQSLTAGSDTRISLAAVKDIKDEIVFFTYHDRTVSHGMYESEDREQNLKLAQKISEKEQLDFRDIVIAGETLPNELKEVLEINHYHHHIPQLLKQYSKFFPEGSIHLRSNLIEIIRGNEHAPLNTFEKGLNIGAYFASVNSYSKKYKYFDEVAKIFNQFYLQSHLDKVFNYSVSHLFYWEYRIGVWCSGAVLTETDLVVDTFQLFNCRRLLNIGLSMPAFYRNRSILYDKVLQNLWPDLLEYGIPNKREQLYGLINKSEIKNGQIYFDQNMELIAGNIFENTSAPPFIFEPYGQGVSFGLSSNKVRKGDYCGFRVKYKIEEGKNYFYQTEIKTLWMQGAQGGIVYELVINGETVYKLPINACFFVNQIRFSFKANESRVDTIEIRVRAEKDINTAIYNSTIDVRCLELKREYGGREYDYVPNILDTYSAVSQYNVMEK